MLCIVVVNESEIYMYAAILCNGSHQVMKISQLI